MTDPLLRMYVRDPREPAVHDLDAVRIDGVHVAVRLSVRRADDGAWRASLGFVDGNSESERRTAEIFYGDSEQELWQSVRSLRDHHFRALYRSVR